MQAVGANRGESFFKLIVVVVVLIEKGTYRRSSGTHQGEAGPRHMVEVYQPTVHVPLEVKESIS
jgi:hypothetical protein